MHRALLLVVVVVGCTSSSDDVVLPGGPVTVRVTRAHDPVANATVVFSGPGGELLSTRLTDGDGRVTADVDGNGMVTAIDPDAPNQLFTITAMRAEAFVEIPLEVSPTTIKPPVATLVIAAPTAGAPAGTDHFTIDTACGTFEAPTLPATLAISRDCFRDSRVPVIVTAATPPGDFEHPSHGLAVVAGFATGTTTDVTFTPGAWSTACTQVDAYVAERMQITFLSRLGGHAFRAFPEFCTVGAPAAGATYALPVLDFGEGAVTTSFGYVEGSLRQATLVRNLAAVPDRVDVGRDPDLLIGDIALLAMDERGATWTHDGALADSDAIVAKLTWSFPQTRYVTWRFLVAGDATDALVPEVPGVSLAGFTSRVAELRFVDASWLRAPEVASLGFLDAWVPEMPADSAVRGYIEQLYPDAD